MLSEARHLDSILVTLRLLPVWTESRSAWFPWLTLTNPVLMVLLIPRRRAVLLICLPVTLEVWTQFLTLLVTVTAVLCVLILWMALPTTSFPGPSVTNRLNGLRLSRPTLSETCLCLGLIVRMIVLMPLFPPKPCSRLLDFR